MASKAAVCTACTACDSGAFLFVCAYACVLLCIPMRSRRRTSFGCGTCTLVLGRDPTDATGVSCVSCEFSVALTRSRGVACCYPDITLRDMCVRSQTFTKTGFAPARASPAARVLNARSALSVRLCLYLLAPVYSYFVCTLFDEVCCLCGSGMLPQQCWISRHARVSRVTIRESSVRAHVCLSLRVHGYW